MLHRLAWRQTLHLVAGLGLVILTTTPLARAQGVTRTVADRSPIELGRLEFPNIVIASEVTLLFDELVPVRLSK